MMSQTRRLWHEADICTCRLFHFMFSYWGCLRTAQSADTNKKRIEKFTK